MSFDAIASSYQRLETLVFGSTLQRARVALLDRIRTPRRVLIVGEGNGRFVSELVTQYPRCEIDCIDASARMNALAAGRLASVSLGAEKRVRFLHVDIFDWNAGDSRYDLVVTHFLLDCFDAAQIAQAVKKIATVLAPQGQWLLADFEIPSRGPMRYFACALVGLMYAFFRPAAGIDATHLIDPAGFFASRGFERTERATLLRGVVKSELWSRR